MKFLTDILARAGLTVEGVVTLNNTASATVDTDKFVVLDGSVVKTRTGAQLLSDIGGQPINTPTSANKFVTVCRNQSGSTLYKGTIVYINGSTGNLPTILKAQANVESTSAGTFGVVESDIANNADGNVVTIGTIDTLDTRTSATNPFTDVTLADGDTIYLHPTVAGYVTNVKPSAPNHLVYVGKVVRTTPTNGAIAYRIQNGYELEELHNVAISSVANNDALFYESATSLWKNKSISTVLGYTPISGTGTAGQITLWSGTSTNSGSADFTWDDTNKYMVANLGLSGYVKYGSNSGYNPGFVVSAYSNFLFSSNARYNGSAWIYDKAGYASQFQAESYTGTAAISTAPTGAAGGTATMTQRFLVTNAGRILLGVTLPTDDTTSALQVNGTIKQTSVTSSLLKTDSTGKLVAAVSGTDYVIPSALNAYLLLTGGTLTGALNGTSATFSSTITASTLTLGSVLFAGTSGVLSQSNASFFWDNTNKRLGIGTTTPAFALTVYGTDAQIGLIQTSTTTGNSQAGLIYQTPSGQVITGVGAINGAILTTAIAGEFIFNNRIGPIVFSADSVYTRKDLYIATNGAATFSSSVTATSHIKTGGTSSQFLKADGSVDSSTYLTTSTASSTYLPLAGGTLTGALNLSTNDQSTSRFKIINTSSTVPLGFSLIAGKAGITHEGFSIYNNTAARTDLYIAETGAATFSSSVAATSATFSGSVQLTSSGSSLSTTYGGVTTMYQLVDTGGGILKVDGDNTIRVVTNNVNRFQINSTAATFTIPIAGTSAIFSSNVAVNTTSPYSTSVYSLDINGGLLVKNTGRAASITLINADPSGGGNNAFVNHTVGGTLTASYANIQTYYGASIAAGILKLQQYGGTVSIWGQLNLTAYTSSTAFTGTAVATLAVDASGNVITITGGGGSGTVSGTTNTIPKFTSSTVLGDSALSDGGAIIVATSRSIQTTGSGNYLRAGNYTWVGGSGGDYGSVGYNQGYTTTTNTYNYVFSDYSSMLKFDVGGFKFKTAPSGTAAGAITYTDVLTITQVGAATFSSTGTFGGRVQSSGGGNSTTDGGFKINYFSNASSRSYLLLNDVTTYGDFGIYQSTTQTGTTYSPLLYFTLAGAATFSSSVTAKTTEAAEGISILGRSDDYSVLRFKKADATTRFTIYTNPNDLIFDSPTIGTAMLIKQSGNVGIGTTSPTEKLSLFGSTATTFGLSLEPSGWNGAKHRLTVPTSGSTSMWSWNWNGSARDYASYGSSNIQLTDNVITFSNGTGNPSEVARFNGTSLLIGTTTDAGYKLDVNGTGRINGSLQVGSGSGGSGTATQSVFQDTYGGNREAIYVKNTADYSAGRGSGYGFLSGAGTEKGYIRWSADDATQTGYFFNLAVTNSSGTLFSPLQIASTGAATFSSTISCTALTETSTIKVKENIVNLDSALTKVEKLQGVSYNRIGSTIKEIGLIAEAVEEIYPEFVQYDEKGEPIGLHYSRLTAVLIESVKELKSRIEELENK